MILDFDRRKKIRFDVPPRVDYALTERGQTLIPPVVALWTWAHDYQAAIETTSCRAFDDDRNR